jgi:F0F1-type ATP synthase membrane subunit c/vacuolar-type H+-ATPase subunit K
MKNVFIGFLTLLAAISLAAPFTASAQLSSGIATYVQIKANSAPEGSIVKFTPDGYTLANTPYETSVFGVVVKEAAISLESNQIPNAKPVVSSGKTYVRVNTNNGTLKAGDLITTSTTPGVGQKATENGYVIGTALEEYKDSKTGLVLAQINITFNGASGDNATNLLSSFRLALSSPYLTPLNALRYIFAAVIVVIALFMSISYFGRVANTGVEALGRNPLAGRTITVGIVINVSLGVGILILAIAVSYLILTL